MTKSGELHGLSRVRALTQDDSLYAFVKHDQIESEMKSILGMVKQMYQTLGMDSSMLSYLSVTILTTTLATEKYGEKAQKVLVDVTEDSGIDYKIKRVKRHFMVQKLMFSLKMAWAVAGSVPRFS